MNLSFFSKFQGKLEKVLIPISSKLGQQRHLAAVRDAMTILLIPLTIIGGFSILLAQPPVHLNTITGIKILLLYFY